MRLVCLLLACARGRVNCEGAQPLLHVPAETHKSEIEVRSRDFSGLFTSERSQKFVVGGVHLHASKDSYSLAGEQ